MINKEMREMEQVQMIKQQIRQYLEGEGLRAYSDGEIEILPLFSLTNDVFRVEVDGRRMLFKIYKPSLPEFTNNELEIMIVGKLAQENLYPKILHYTNEYRIEQFLEARQFNRGNLDRIKLLSIIKKLAHFSCTYSQEVERFHSKAGTLDRFSLLSLLQIFRYIYSVKKLECPALVMGCIPEIQSIFNNWNNLNCLLWILELTPKMLCHNDCHIGNLLITSNGEYILDYEFANFNYVGYDLGNFLNEWATEYGGEFQIREELEMDNALKDEIIRAYFQGLGKKFNEGYSFQKWRYLVQLGRVLSHLFWMIIGLKQINDPRIGFSMVYYIKRRHQQFRRHLKELLQLGNDF